MRSAAQVFPVLLVVTALFAACSLPVGTAPAQAVPTSSVGDRAGAASSEARTSAQAPMAAAKPAAATPAAGVVPGSAARAAPAGLAATAAAPAQEAPLPQVPNLGRMIIYNATIGIVVRSLADAIDRLGTVARAYDGYLASVDYKQNDRRSGATASLRVRADAYNDAMRDIRGLAVEVKEESANTQDVTEEYDDLQTQIRTLEAVEQQYQEFLKRAQTIDETLRIQQRIEETRLRINRLKGRSVFLDRKSSLATINVAMTEFTPALATPTPTPVPTATPIWDPDKVIDESWQASLRVLATVAQVALRVVVFFWWAIPLLLLAFALLVRRRTRSGAGNATV